MIKYFLVVLSVFFLACNGKTAHKDDANAGETSGITTTSPEEISISENEAEPLIIDSVYLVRNSEGLKTYGSVPLRYLPDEESAYGMSARLGEKLYVVEDNGEWLKIWSPINRDRSGNYYDDLIYGSLYIKKEFTGKFEELKVSEHELPIIYDYYAENKQKRVSEDTLAFELITENEYLKQKAASVSLLVCDTLAITKNDGVIILPCVENTVTLTDIDSDGDSSRSYYYIGHMPYLNVYLIRAVYYESGDYFFIDRNSGKKTASFADFPVVSPDGIYVADIWGNVYEDSTQFGISKLNEDGTAETLIYCVFTKWMPFNSAYYKEIDYFWGNDNNLYVKIQAALLAAQVYEDYAAQYIKVKIGLMAHG